MRVLGVAGEEEGGRGWDRDRPLEKAADESRKERKNVNTRHLADREPTPLPGLHLNINRPTRARRTTLLRLRLVLNAHHQRLR